MAVALRAVQFSVSRLTASHSARCNFNKGRQFLDLALLKPNLASESRSMAIPAQSKIICQSSTVGTSSTTSLDNKELKVLLKKRADEFVRNLVAWEKEVGIPDKDAIGTPEVVASREDLIAHLHWLRWAMAAYKETTDALITTLSLPEKSDLLKHNLDNFEYQPVYYIAVDHSKKLLVFGVRGTISKKDVVTDITGVQAPFVGGYAHSGMLLSAKNLLKKEKAFVEQTLKDLGDYKLVITGHSLGAGVATLMTLTLKSEKGYLADKVSSWGYGCPPVVDLKKAKESSEYIKVVVDLNDVVPRVGVDSLRDLIEEIVEYSDSLGHEEFQRRLKPLLEPLESIKSALIAHATADPASSATTDSEKIADAISSVSYEGTDKDHSIPQPVLEGIIQFESLVKEKIEEVATAKKNNSWFSFSKLLSKIPFISNVFEKVRLYVPGTLHHIKRSPEPKTEKELILAAEDEKAVIDFWLAELSSSDGVTNVGENYDDVFVIERGIIQERFRNIKVSETMVSDHNCDNYGNGLFRALKYI